METTKLDSLVERAYRYFGRGLLLAARECLEQWCANVRDHYPHRVCESLNALGSVYIELGLTEEAVALFTQSLEWEPPGSPIDRVRSLCNISLCSYLLGRYTDSVSYGERAFALLEEAGEADAALWAHMQEILGLAYGAAGEWMKAVAAGEAAKQAFRRLGDTAGVAKVLNNLGLIHGEAGRLDEAEQLLGASLSLMESIRDFSTTAYTYTELGRLMYKKGDIAGAVRYGGRALRLLWDNMGQIDKAEVARLCELFGSISSSLGDRRGAVTYLQRASTYYAQRDMWREWQNANDTLNLLIRDGGERQVQNKIAIALEDRRLLRYFTTLLGLLDTLESLHPDLRSKSELVTKYALLVGEACGLQGVAIERISHAARLHEIGFTSMGVRESSDLPEGVDSSHPVIGERVLRMFGLHEEVQKAVRHQCERYDGSGSPDGLKGSDIPLFSRIIAVVEAYVSHVMAHPDPGAAHSSAMAAIAAESGSRFDPEIIEALIALHRDTQCDPDHTTFT